MQLMNGLKKIYLEVGVYINSYIVKTNSRLRHGEVVKKRLNLINGIIINILQ